MKIHYQTNRFKSPWPLSHKIKQITWEITWALLCSWTPKPFNKWRIVVLKVFGAKIYGKPFVHQRARIQIPWNIILHNKACIGDRTNIYSLGLVIINEYATIAQEAYICTGTHAFNMPEKNLITKPVIIGKNAFIGARAFILPGISVGDNVIIGACSVVTKNINDNLIVKGNPCR